MKKGLTILSVLVVLAIFASVVFAQAQNRSSVRITSGRVIVDGRVFIAPPVRNVPFTATSTVSWGEGTVGALVTPSGNILSMTETDGLINTLQFNGTEPVQVISGSVTIVGSLPGAEPEVLALVIGGEVITVTVPVGAVADVGLTVDESGAVQLAVVAVSGDLVLEDESGNSVVVETGSQISATGDGGLAEAVVEAAPPELILALVEAVAQISETVEIEVVLIQEIENIIATVEDGASNRLGWVGRVCHASTREFDQGTPSPNHAWL